MNEVYVSAKFHTVFVKFAAWKEKKKDSHRKEIHWYLVNA